MDDLPADAFSLLGTAILLPRFSRCLADEDCYNDGMTASLHLKVLSVRLPEAEIRRFKSLAASRGVSVQAAVHQAMEAWASEEAEIPAEPLDSLQGSLADVDVFQLLREEKEIEQRKDRDRIVA